MVDELTESHLLRWIPLLPLIAAVVHGVLLAVVRRSLPRGVVILLSCGAVILSFLLSFVALIELMLNAVNVALVAFSRLWGNLDGQIFVLMVIVVAAAEVAVGLGIVISLFRNRESVNVEDVSLLKW